MLFSTPSSTLAVFLSLLLLSFALPFYSHTKDLELEQKLIPRASYSVVPVDGGAPSPAATVSPDATTTVIETVTQSAQPRTTLTIVSTITVPASTEILTSIATVTAQDTTEIYEWTFTQAPATVTVTTANQQTTAVSSPISTAYASAAVTTSISCSTSPITSNCTSTSTVLTTTSSKTYDDGFWHTTYPVWSNSSSTTAIGPTSSPTISLS